MGETGFRLKKGELEDVYATISTILPSKLGENSNGLNSEPLAKSPLAYRIHS
jgi:hypothetical protein